MTLCALWLLGLGLFASDHALLHIDEDDGLFVALPKAELRQDKVRQQLESGLTTTLLIQIDARSISGSRTKIRGAARLDIRYEPWDEVFLVTCFHHDGRIEKLTAIDYDALLSWLNENPPKVAILLPRNTRWSVEVSVNVLPFSQREADRTQRWFAKTLSNPGNERSDPNRMLDLLAASAIKRKPLVRFFWKEVFRP